MFPFPCSFLILCFLEIKWHCGNFCWHCPHPHRQSSRGKSSTSTSSQISSLKISSLEFSPQGVLTASAWLRILWNDYRWLFSSFTPFNHKTIILKWTTIVIIIIGLGPINCLCHLCFLQVWMGWCKKIWRSPCDSDEPQRHLVARHWALQRKGRW